MPSMTEARRLIQSEFRTYRDANFTGMPTAWDNKRFETKGKKEFMRVNVQHQAGTKPALGNPLQRRTGTVFVQIFTELDSDMRRSDALTQLVLDLFAKWPNLGVDLWDPTANEAGPDDAWFQVNVSATFQYDDFG